MTAAGLVTALGSYGGAFAVGALSSLLPLVSIELFLVALTLGVGATPATAGALAVLAAAGQVLGKLPIYAASRGATHVGGPRLGRLRERLARHHHLRHLTLAASTLLGLPPFSVMATVAGALAIRLPWFCAIVFVGRAARFAVLIALATLVPR